MRRSTVLSLPLQLVFPGRSNFGAPLRGSIRVGSSVAHKYSARVIVGGNKNTLAYNISVLITTVNVLKVQARDTIISL
jgi:hypothetical protein